MDYGDDCSALVFPTIEAIVLLWFHEKKCGRLERFSEDKILNFAIIRARFNQTSLTVVFEAFF